MKQKKICSECGCEIPIFEQPAYRNGNTYCKNCFNRINGWKTGRNRHGRLGRLGSPY